MDAQRRRYQDLLVAAKAIAESAVPCPMEDTTLVLVDGVEWGEIEALLAAIAKAEEE